jgi:hypothetical protein
VTSAVRPSSVKRSCIALSSLSTSADCYLIVKVSSNGPNAPSAIMLA